MSEHETVYGFMKGASSSDDGPAPRSRAARGAVTRAIERVDLADAQHRPMGTYSRGMRQRMRLAATLVHEPDILILDEPLNGADPRQRVHFQHLLRQLAGEGRTIVLSSHILEEVEQIAETVLLVVNGKLAASGGFRAIRAALDQRPYHVRVVCDAPRRLRRSRSGFLGRGGQHRPRRRPRDAEPAASSISSSSCPGSLSPPGSVSRGSSRSTTRSKASSATWWRADDGRRLPSHPSPARRPLAARAHDRARRLCR